MRSGSVASNAALQVCALAAAKPPRWRSSSCRTMAALTTRIDRASKEYLQNSAAMDTQLTDLADRLSQIRLGGGESVRKRHTERGKLLPRARIETLLDRNADFFEFSPFAAHGVYENPLPTAGLINRMLITSWHPSRVFANGL